MKNFIDLQTYIYEGFKNIRKGDLEYIYRGTITPLLVMNILDLARTNLAKADDTAKIKSRIYYIMGEGLQNITRHQILPDDWQPEKIPIIVILKRNFKYFITTGNLILRENVQPLREKLEKINSLTVEELRLFSRYVRLTTDISEKGGASLGLIEMAKRSGNKLKYDFVDIDDKYSYFYLNTEIPTMVNDDVQKLNRETSDYSIENLKEFHKLLNKENFILTFKGDFNQDNLLYLLNMVKSQMKESVTSIKLYNIMIELLQNIVKHADNIDNDNSWKPGIFLINEKDDTYLLTAGNYVINDKVLPLKEHLDFINSLDSKQLDEQYKEILFNFDTEDPLKTGLGIIDMRRRSGDILKYNFTKTGNNYNFFIIQVTLKKN